MADERLSNQFLIAMPNLADPNFSRTVTYLCDHNEDGAMGVVINRPTDVSLADIIGHMGLEGDEERLRHIPVYQGGPVQVERGFVLHRPLGKWEATLPVTDEIGITMSRDIVEAIVRDEDAPEHYLIALGYAGWGSGQLEAEMAANAWLNGPADPAILFEKPVAQRWLLSAADLGVDLSLLSTDVGHA
ncbi:MAG TPA: YqgE/AlgH family protein [Gammaproteobacteria bacterium]|nr:YqgE/AlgH family protein [Gammaproteobacteria bacterium]